jgi:hypothetical protein
MGKKRGHVFLRIRKRNDQIQDAKKFDAIRAEVAKEYDLKGDDLLVFNDLLDEPDNAKSDALEVVAQDKYPAASDAAFAYRERCIAL